MSQVFLVGFMGAGKTTVARLVSRQLGRPMVDLDAAIEAVAGRSVREIFEDVGEEAFRELESARLRALSSAEPSVVACGGGIVVRDENRSTLKGMGLVVYLRVSAGETLARVGADGTRPLLAGPGGAIAATRLLEARESLYAAVADVTIDTVGRSVDEVAMDVATAIKEHESEERGK
jgi:shikimate kinase